MLASLAAHEDRDFPSSVAAGDTQKVSGEASPERRREFENILSHGLPRLRRMAMRWLGNPEDAEDAVQDALLSAFKNIARFEGRAQMSTWLMAIVTNGLRMRLRRRPRHQMLSLDEGPSDSQWTPAEWLVDPGPTPEQSFEQCELREIVTKLICTLPASQRAALRLRRRDDFSIRSAAETLGLPVGTVKARLARGRAKLIERFRKATRVPKGGVSCLEPKARGKASGKRDRAKGLGLLPTTVFSEQGGCEGSGRYLELTELHQPTEQAKRVSGKSPWRLIGSGVTF
jgi:RNA polymerase sigma-70 factor (ECF subfamily)